MKNFDVLDFENAVIEISQIIVAIKTDISKKNEKINELADLQFKIRKFDADALINYRSRLKEVNNAKTINKPNI